MNCEYCHKQFTTKGLLSRHQQNAKFCIKIQEELNDKIKLVICNGCNKELSSKQKLQSHQQICKKYEETNKIQDFEKIIADLKTHNVKLENRVKELEDKLVQIALKSTGKTSTHNGNTYVYQNFTPITDEKLKKDALTFTKRHLELGGQGIAHFVLKNTLKDNFTCTDVSRGHTKYIDESGDLVIDPFSHSITRRVCQSLVEPSEKINNDNKSTLSYDTSDSVFTKAGLLNETVNDIKKASTGVENELTREFTKTICSDSVRKCI